MRTQEVSATLAPLVEQGAISAEQARAVSAALTQESSEQQRTRRHILSEVLSYIGGAVIIISGAFIVAQAWEPLGAWGRSGLIMFGAVVMFIGAWILAGRQRDNSARRLAGALFVGAATLTAVAVGSLLQSLYIPDEFVYDPATAWRQPGVISIATACGLVVAIAGYAKVRSIIGQAGIAFAAAATLMGVGTAATYYQDQSDMAFPMAGFWLVFALGIGWIAISRVGAFAEPVFALVVGAVLVLFGAQATRSYESLEWLSGTLFLGLGLAFLALYLWWREWPMLAAGVAAILIGGIELFVRYLEGIGAALGSLALGIVLLVVGLLMLRGRSSHEQVGRT